MTVVQVHHELPDSMLVYGRSTVLQGQRVLLRRVQPAARAAAVCFGLKCGRRAANFYELVSCVLSLKVNPCRVDAGE